MISFRMPVLCALALAVAATAATAGMSNSRMHPAAGSSAARTAGGTHDVSPFTGRLAQRDRAHRHEVGAGCTVVNPSSAMLQGLYGSPPYSAAIAVTTNGTIVSGSNVNANGCDFGVYVAQGVDSVTISGNTIHDAFQVGIANDGATNVNSQGNQVSQTGWHDSNGWDPNGVQTGLGIYYLYGTGDISNNLVTTYQKNGITVNYSTNASLENNVAVGFGSPSNPTQFIAQNGIQVYMSNLTMLLANSAEFNWYGNPSYGATGFLLCGVTLNGNPITKVQKGHLEHQDRNRAFDNNYNFYIAPSC